MTIFTTGVTVLSNDPAVAAAGCHSKPLGHKEAEAGWVQIGSGTNNPVFGQPAQLPRHIRQNINCKTELAFYFWNFYVNSFL